MATKNIVPNADSEGGIGTSSKYWATGFIDAITTTGNLVVGGSIDLEGAIDVNGTTNLDIVDIDGAVNMATTALVTGVLTTTATQVANGGITSGGNIVSDTDSTDDLGTTSVRWANLFVDGITATDQITATGFTGTLDGILGSGTPAAATVTTLNTSGNIVTAAAAARVTIQDNADSASGGTLAIQNTDTGVNNHEGGRLYFYADDSSNNVIEAGLITSIFTNVSPTAKASSLRLSTYGSNGQVHTLTLAGTGIQVVDSGTIGCASDTDLLTLTDGKLNVSGKIGIGVSPTTLLHLNGTGDAIRVESTNAGAGGAQMDLLHFSASPADNDVMGAINMGGYYSGTSSAYFGAIKTVATDISARNGELQFFTNNSGTFTNQLTISSGGSVKIGNGSTATPSTNADDLFIDKGAAESGITILSTAASSLRFGDGANVNIGSIEYNHNSDYMRMIVNNAERMRISSGGDVNIGTADGLPLMHGSVAANASYCTYSFVNDADTGMIRTGANTLALSTAGSSRLTISSGGNVFVTSGNLIAGATSDVTGTHYFQKAVSVNGGILYAGSSTTGRFSLIVQASDMGYNNTPATCLKIGGTNSTSRSISAAGTVNVSGNDYAEYMTKAITDDISKGDVVGINSDGLLTNIFSDAISFVIKSTDPSFVGGDIWGIESEDEDDIEEARIKVDRIAFSGQVPCNVTGASVGDYIIPVASSDGKITGEAVSNPTFEQYKISVGKVWKIMENGNSWVAVKIG